MIALYGPRRPLFHVQMSLKFILEKSTGQQRCFSALACTNGDKHRRNRILSAHNGPGLPSSALSRKHFSVAAALEDFYFRLATSPLTGFISESFCWIHDNSGLSWSATIILTSFSLRFLCTLPAHATSQKVFGFMRVISPSDGSLLCS